MAHFLENFGNLTNNYEEMVAVVLFAIGFCILLFSRNLIKKVVGLDIMDTGVFLLLASRGYIEGRTVPIIVDGVTSMEHYINPIPAGLVLTGIVVSVSVSALMLSLTVRIYRTYHTLNIDDLYMMMSYRKKEGGRL
jgi:multicomponent Na+:H+ antiporter subunit C